MIRYTMNVVAKDIGGDGVSACFKKPWELPIDKIINNTERKAIEGIGFDAIERIRETKEY